MLIAPRAPASSVLGKPKIVGEVESPNTRAEEHLEVLLGRLQVLPGVVEATNDSSPEERFDLRAVVAGWHEDLVTRLEAEGFDTHE